MPHVIVKLVPGRSATQKTQLSNAIVEAITRILDCGAESVSVAMQEISAEDWKEKVYRRDLLAHPDLLYKNPGYTM